MATYVADARMLQLHLVSPFGGDPMHDWNYLLGEMGLLQRDDDIAFWMRLIATLCMATSIFWGAWILFWIVRQRE